MNFIFTGKNIAVSDIMKQKTEQKISRAKKLFPENVDIYVTFSVVKNDNTIEVTVPLQKRTLRAEVTAPDMYAAIDDIVDILEKQMVKYRKRLKDKSRRDGSFKDELNYVPMASSFEEEADDANYGTIEKTKKFALKPMDAEEAVMEMEMIGHSFFVFRNGQTDEVNVVYKRKNGSYGLIEPEY